MHPWVWFKCIARTGRIFTGGKYPVSKDGMKLHILQDEAAMQVIEARLFAVNKTRSPGMSHDRGKVEFGQLPIVFAVTA
jgi:hypothetical protein